jgi:hypothetical protein
MADILVRFQQSMRLNVHFAATQANGAFSIEEEVDKNFPIPARPKAYFPNSNSHDLSSAGDPEFRIGPVDLPLEAEADQAVRNYPRDVFGRWGQMGLTTCRLRSWPVSAPGLLAVEVGMVIAPTNSPTLTNLKSADNVNLPNLGNRATRTSSI